MGSVQQVINLRDLRRVEVPLPPLPEQRAIAHILGTLDDKIELNRRMNATLEAIARTLFQSWFVDFDPVRAKSEGREPEGMDAETAALFPDAFEDSELGPIPKGWRVAPLDDGVNLIGGGTPKTSVPHYWNGDIPWFSVVDAPRDSDIFVLDTEKHITQKGLDNCSTRLLPAGTSIISARGTVGRCAVVGVPMAMNQSCYAIQGRHPGTDYFTYYCLRFTAASLQQKAHGSVFDTITRDTFKGVLQTTAPASIAQQFDRTILALMEKVKANLAENRTLAAIRDALLPKLLSGQMRVPEAERFVETAAATL